MPCQMHIPVTTADPVAGFSSFRKAAFDPVLRERSYSSGYAGSSSHEGGFSVSNETSAGNPLAIRLHKGQYTDSRRTWKI